MLNVLRDDLTGALFSAAWGNNGYLVQEGLIFW